MHSKQPLFLAILLVIPFCIVNAQHQTSSPYSSYGIGQLRQAGYSYNMGMGYTGVANRTSTHINPVNPASYTAFPDKTFSLEAGLKYNMSKFSTNNASDKRYDTNIDYLALGFPITSWWSFAAGITPYSAIGYNMTDEQGNYTTEYEGSGGLNEVSFGTSFELFNHVSIGINGSYIFGKTEQNIVTDFDPDYSRSILTREDISQFNGLNVNAGVQGQFSVSNWDVTLGATYNNKRSLNAERDVRTIQILSVNEKNYRDTLASAGDFHGTMTIPAKYGIGIAVSNKSWQLSADYTMQNWRDATFHKTTAARYSPRKTYKFGAEYTPDIYSTNYLKIIHYRMGGYYRNTGLQLPVDDGGRFQNIERYGITAGLMLPVPNTGTMFNLGLDFGKYGTNANNLLAENYLTINFGFVFKDIWFKKRKFN